MLKIRQKSGILEIGSTGWGHFDPIMVVRMTFKGHGSGRVNHCFVIFHGIFQ